MTDTTRRASERPSHRLRPVVWGGAAAVLAGPLLAMRFGAEVDWTPFDFALAGAMLISACGAYELAARVTGDITYRAGAGLAIAGALLLAWINLAVGFIGDEGDPANLMYGGVLAVLLIGAVAARGRPGGMAFALVTTAFAQAAAGLIAFTASLNGELAADLAFVALWLGSAALFQEAERRREARAAQS